MAVNLFRMTSRCGGSQKHNLWLEYDANSKNHINKHVNKWPSVDCIVSDMRSLELCECAKTFGNTCWFLNKAGLVFHSEHVQPLLQGSSGVFDANRCTSVPKVCHHSYSIHFSLNTTVWENVILSLWGKKNPNTFVWLQMSRFTSQSCTFDTSIG